MIEITKACIVAFMKAKNSLVVWCKEKKENRRWWKLWLKICCEHQKVAYGRPSIKWTSWKDNDMLCYYVIIPKND